MAVLLGAFKSHGKGVPPNNIPIAFYCTKFVFSWDLKPESLAGMLLKFSSFFCYNKLLVVFFYYKKLIVVVFFYYKKLIVGRFFTTRSLL